MKQETKQTIFLFLMVVFIILLIFALVLLIKNKDLLKSNPIEYGIKQYNFTYCTCFNENQMITFPKDFNLQWGNLK